MLALALMAAALAPPRLFRRRHRLLDACILAALAVPLLQTIPLPAPWRQVLSPGTDRLNAVLHLAAVHEGFAPLSLLPSSTLNGLGVGVTLALVFWTCRRLFADRGIRTLSKATCGLGLAMSVIAILVRPTSNGLVYGFWQPNSAGTNPFGPFVDPNDAACWLVMAIPLGIGYLTARTQERRQKGRRTIDQRAVWVGGSLVMMFAGLIASLSRSGAVGLAVAFLTGGVIAAAKGGRRERLWLGGIVTAALLLALFVPRTAALAGRFETIRWRGSEGRMTIWRESVPIVRDFPVAGVGIGAYPMAMRVYQQSSRDFFFNEPHNQVLQVFTDGGFLLALPLGLAVLIVFARAIRRLTTDRTRTFWIRLGAVSGLAGMSAQVMWDAGLSRPANSLLAVVLVAVAMHSKARRHHRDHSGR